MNKITTQHTPATFGGPSLAIAANCREWAGEFRELSHPVTLTLFAAAQKLEANAAIQSDMLAALHDTAENLAHAHAMLKKTAPESAEGYAQAARAARVAIAKATGQTVMRGDPGAFATVERPAVSMTEDR